MTVPATRTGVTLVTRLDSEQLRASADSLADLLVDTVRGGNSLGFLADLDRATAAAWWHGLGPAVGEGRLAVWVVRGEGTDAGRVTGTDAGRVTGTVGVAFVDKPNGRHRAEIVKLMVHPSARGQGLARALLTVAEEAAAQAGVTLLVLDTETGSPAETFYRKAGWTRSGTIPDYATDPAGTPRPTTLFHKRLGAGRTGAEPADAARQ
ncbi:GNAT family N-acetyltransferase [Streptomyces sp. NPDC046465]|uniref:GNAT family N-acetyltransferase n=1 Tax=Streptomyces sp. NPDC046465 TaxID=3155810 RepID=UPI00340149B0